MEPLSYIKTKTDIENKLELLEEINLENKSKKVYNNKVQKLLQLICEAIKIQINMAEEKDDIIKLIYKIRYFGFIYFSETEQIKNIINLEEIQKMIITKACKQRIITIFSKKINENYEITKFIFQIDIIELENIYLKLKQCEKNIELEILDEENTYKTLSIPEITELNVKTGKKIKIFI